MNSILKKSQIFRKSENLAR